MAVLKRDKVFNELFIKPIHGLYSEQSITVDEFKDRHESVMKNRWVDTSHGTKDDKIYGMFDPSVDSDITKENLQEWLCDNRLEVTECISVALCNHECSYAEWFRYVDSCSGPDELALYCLSRKMGIHMAVFNKSYIWTTLADHITHTDEEIIQLWGVNLVFLGPAHYGILCDIRRPSKNMGPVVNPKSATSTPNPPLHRNKKTTCRDGRSADQKKGCGRSRGCGKPANSSNERKQSHTLSELCSRNYGIIPPNSSTRTLRSGLQPVDYVTLNDGFNDEPTANSRKRKRVTHRPRSVPSATRVAAQKHTTSPEAIEASNKGNKENDSTLSGVTS